MNTGIEIKPSERERGTAWVRIWPRTHARLKQIAKDSDRDMVEILDLAIAQIVVAEQKREMKLDRNISPDGKGK